MSMTGFGRGEYTGLRKKAVVEIKSVNHRYCEVLIKLPRQYTLMEDGIKRQVMENISRGRVEVFCKLEDSAEPARQVQVDKELALAYYKALKELAVITETSSDISAWQISQLPDVLRVEEPEENLDEIWNDLLPALRDAIGMFVQMRAEEGAKLKKDLEEHLDLIAASLAQVEQRSPSVVVSYRERLTTRLKELLDNVPVDESRLAMETALFADRASIAEEIVRLKSHLTQFAQTLQDNAPVGRKLDFLLQEMNREVNTIGSKANDLEITQQVVAMKSELEKLREQVQNIE